MRIGVQNSQISKQGFCPGDGHTDMDAKGLSRLYRPAASPTLMVGMVISACLPILVALANSAGLQRWLGLLGMSLEVWLRRHGLR